MGAHAYAVIDDALALLRDTGPEFGVAELSNHGPMAAEALCAMGRSDSVIGWVERYRRRLREHPARRAAITRDSWREALGDFSRAGDWVQFFEAELQGAPWADALDRWAGVLAPGAIAAAFHGLIRTAHAVRSLSHENSPARLHELAEGLGYWAARYRQLPESGEGARAHKLPSAAIDEVAVLPQERRRTARNIDQAIAALEDFAPFKSVAALADLADPDAALSDLTATFARVLLANSSRGVIALIHGVTGPAAVRLMLPYLGPGTAPRLLRYCWQGAAALYATFCVASRPAELRAPAEPIDDLIGRALRSGDEHAIKFTEACIREHALNPDPAYPAAARHAVDLLGGARPTVHRG